jgi:amidase
MKPNLKDLRSISAKYHLNLTPGEIRVFKDKIDVMIDSYARMNELAASSSIYPKHLGSSYLPVTGHFPSKKENTFGAWAWKCVIRKRVRKGAKLQGKKVAIKDNIAVKNVPMRNGSELLKNFVPSFNATIVNRILDAGGTILGKAACENLCLSSGSHTSYLGPVRNPWNTEYMAGGSSSGSAVLVATRQVDMAIGADQAGSIRIPSSWCGIFGLKPTRGLVPYTGIIGMDPLIDHVGPMASSVYDLALLLEVIAGKDHLDPRQLNVPQEIPSYVHALRNKEERDGTEMNRSLRKIRIGIVVEGFGWDRISEKDVDSTVTESAHEFQNLDAKVSEVSIPAHRDAIHIWSGLAIEGALNGLLRPNSPEQVYSPELDGTFFEQWERSVEKFPDKLAETAKIIMLLGDYMSKKYHSKYYNLARNLRSKYLIKAYNEALEAYDLLLMPTTPQKARRFDDLEGGSKKRRMKSSLLNRSVDVSFSNIQNTCAFDVSGHPAISVPCGFSKSDKLPIGMMLVGRYFEELTLLQASRAFEKYHKITPPNQFISSK